MEKFTGFEYLCIDAANQFGLDKKLFNERIDWAKAHLDKLESMVGDADNKPLFVKAVMAIRKAQQGIPTGHLVGFDASCSGIQIMSAITGCKAGAEATGLVNPNVRADAYTTCTKVMNDILGGVGVSVSRSDAKKALMTSFYGSKEQPKAIFGEGTPELNAFYQAANTIAPGAWDLLQDLLASWQPYALSHQWTLPDGYEAKVKVMSPVEHRIEVDELGHASFTYEYKENRGQAKGLSNVANVVHSIDAYVLRSIHRRCNYNFALADHAAYLISNELQSRHAGWSHGTATDKFVIYFMDLYERSNMVDVAILPHINEDTVLTLPSDYLKRLLKVLDSMLVHKPFEVVTVHDEFKCHANHMNHLRQHYINIFCELAESTILDMIMSEIMGGEVKYQKLSDDLSEHIAQSNYALT